VRVCVRERLHKYVVDLRDVCVFETGESTVSPLLHSAVPSLSVHSSLCLHVCVYLFTCVGECVRVRVRACESCCDHTECVLWNIENVLSIYLDTVAPQ